MKQVINRLMYDTNKAEILCSDRYWDGSNMDRMGRNTYLYKSKNGRYFTYNTTRWQGEIDCIVPKSKKEAKAIWEHLPEKEVEYEKAFNETPEEA